MERLSVGFRFDPTDREIIDHFLFKKLNEEPLSFNPIIECDLFDKESPQWRDYFEKTNEKNLWFFTILKKKTEKGSHIERITNCGTWKSQNNNRLHKDGTKTKENWIGSRRNFSFVPKKGLKMNCRWVMHEYRIDGSLLNKTKRDDYVLCMVRKIENIKEDVELKQQQEQERDMENMEVQSILQEAEIMENFAAYQVNPEDLLLDHTWFSLEELGLQEEQDQAVDGLRLQEQQEQDQVTDSNPRFAEIAGDFTACI